MPRIIKPAVGSFTASNITIDSSGRIIAATHLALVQPTW